MARLTFKGRADGSGLRLSLAPSWGEAAGRAMFGGDGLLGTSGIASVLPAGGAATAAGGYDASLAMQGGVGYGFAFDRGLLSFDATQNRDARTVRETFGLSWESAGGGLTNTDPALESAGALSFRLGYERSRAVRRGSPSFELVYTARF